MKKLLVGVFAAFAFMLSGLAQAQQIQVNRDNRTIAVTVTESVQVEPELGIVEVGYHNFGATKDQVYDENTRAADRITKAFFDAGISKDDIETSSIQLQQVDTEDKNWTAEERKQRQFEAHQSWKIRVRVSDAQRVVDLAVSAGANDVQDVDWVVADPKALEDKADAAALAKARGLAEQMAPRLGAKVGSLLYASNQLPTLSYVTRSGVSYETAMVNTSVSDRSRPVLKLFPRKVIQQATVYAIFALE